MSKSKRHLKSETIMIRVTPAQLRDMRRAAKAHASLAAWAREVLVRASTLDGEPHRKDTP